jgi:hypothetical protein
MPTEYWKRYGRVAVTRNAKGQFVKWQRVPTPRMPRGYRTSFGFFGKQVSVYGHCSNGVGERYDFHGTGKDLYRAIHLAHRIVPKRRFVRVSASEFLANPYRYGARGFWIDRAVES